MKLKIVSQHIEKDLVNNEPKLILTDENGTEWVMSSRTACPEGGAIPILVEKSNDWYFQEPK